MIKIDAITKKFRLYRSPSDRIKEIILRRVYHREVIALNNISFDVSEGESIGIIGVNGAGKSTLLKILIGILIPDSGQICMDGKITGLLELGTGFNYEKTGLENIYMNGSLIGLGKEQIDHKKQEIIDFTELGDFIYNPVKTYSSGMIIRLAFSIAFHADPKCFVVDEALSVGDAYFQQKCMRHIRDFRWNGGSIIFVSHDLNAVKMLCDKALLLNRGAIIEMGSPEEVINHYNCLIAKMSHEENQMIITSTAKRSYGTFEARIIMVTVRGENSHSNVINSGELATIEIIVKSIMDLNDTTVGFLIRDRYGQDIFGTNTYHYGYKNKLEKGKTYSFSFVVRMDIGPGVYTVTTAIHTKDAHIENCFHWLDSSVEFKIAGNYNNYYIGLCKLYPELRIATLADS